jgi:hypothetical protein
MLMTKLFLTGIAARLLATGTARADDESDAALQERCKNGATYWCTVLEDRLTGAERPPPPPPEPPKAKQKTVLHSDSGGNISIYFERFKALEASGDDVEIRGKCLSACTLITVFIPRKRLCFGETAWLGFHHAMLPNGAVCKEFTELMFDSYPPDIRRWLYQRGGTEKMPDSSIGFWAISASELWKMGYRKCEPEARELK